MPRSGSAKRYAEALAQIAQQDNSWQAWREDLDRLATILANRPLQLIMESPRAPVERKLSILNQLLGGSLRPEARNLLAVLARRGHINLLPQVREFYVRAFDAAEGIERYEVTSAAPLDDAERRQLRERLGESQGKTVVLREHVDPELLGGVVIRHGDIIRDYSVRGRLEALREILKQAQV